MKKKFRILGHLGLAVFLVSALLLAAVPLAKPTQATATAVTDVWMEFAAAGNDATATSEYKIHFTTTTAMKRGVDTITVIFPTDFDLTSATTTGSDYDVKVGTVTTDGDRSVTIGGQRIQVTTPVNIPASTAAVLIVTAGATIVTPSTDAHNYTIKLATSQDTTLVTSAAFAVDNTVLTALVSTNTYPSSLVAGATAAYKWTFTIVTTVPIGGTVTVEFPVGTTLPSTISTANVYVGNGSEDPTASAVVVDTAARTVTATTAESLTASGMVLYIKSEAGIQNKTTTGHLAVHMWTSTDGQKYPQQDTDDTIVAGVATKLAFTSSSDDATILNSYTGALVLQAQDQYGNKNTGESTTVLVSVTTGTGTVHTAQEGSGGNLWGSSVALSSGTDNVFYMPTAVGTHTLTASVVSGTTMTAGTIDITVAPAVVLKDSSGNTIATYGPAANSWGTTFGGPEIQSAINASFPGDTVELGTGVYELSSALTLSQKITLTKASGATPTLRPTSDNMLAIEVTITGTAADPIIIDGLIFTRLSSSVEFDRGVRVFGYSYVTVSNNTFNYIKPTHESDHLDGSVVMIGISSTTGATNTSITSATISGNTFTNSGSNTSTEGGKTAIISVYVQNGVSTSKTITGVTISGNTITDNAGIAITTNAGHQSGQSVTATISGNTLTNPYSGIVIQRRTANVKVLDNTITGGYMYAIRVEKGTSTAIHTALLIKNNTITGAAGAHSRAAAVIIDQDGQTGSGTANPVTLQYNAIYDNDSTYNIRVATDGRDVTLDARYNWYGSASGPGTTVDGTYSADVATITFTPWLHKSLATVVADNASYPTLKRSLSVGWNTLSAPGKLISTEDALNELVPAGVIIAYKYDGGWVQITTDVLNPLDAVYIKMSSAQTVLLKVDGAAFSTPTKSLAAGWNLIGLASLTDMEDKDSIASASGSYSQLVSPSMNSASWTYIAGAAVSTDQRVKVGEGYWIFMQSSATLAGFTILPMAPSLN